MQRRQFHGTLASSLFLSASGASLVTHASEPFPTKQISLVVSYGAGGSLDVIARALAAALVKELGQFPMILNIAGGSGAIGVKRVRDAAVDGHTLLVGTVSEVVVAPLTVRAAGFQPSELAPIAKIGTSGIVIAARPGLPVANLQELVALAREKPGLTYGVPGAGSFHHLAMESLAHRAGIKFSMVPYKGAAQATTDLIGGHVDLAVIGLPALLPMIRAGEVTPLAVMGLERDIGNAAIPTVRESPGFKGFEFDLWTGLFAPRRVSRDVAARLNEAINKTISSPPLADQFQRMGVKPAKPQPAAEFASYVASETSKFETAMSASGLAPQ